ncbi:hypothetical protein AVEN_249565-1 [Araneus ventricosus]|uniref:Tc1-like transposase DDE domain-containing protein n=1 Tax=Araneus ventricosus TaxID=182803 RepID=A0A4Y2KMJ8_ARAVE|nr:hypothetical protein AVEN_249565-1 [Araneus ventricosus]
MPGEGEPTLCGIVHWISIFSARAVVMCSKIEAMKDVLKNRFTKERVISQHFCNLWPLQSPDLNPCDLWLWGYLKHLKLTENDGRHVEHDILRFQMLAENDGRHVEHDILRFQMLTENDGRRAEHVLL